MRKSIKIVIAIFILAITFVTPLVVYANVNIPEATSDFYVNDFANVFSSSEKEQLMDKAIALSNKYDGIQVVVTTVKSLEGNSVEDYAYEMYNRYGIGKNDMGLLILLATEDRKIRVEVGKSMEAYINDSKAGRFVDQYAIPYFSPEENKFSDGLISLQEALIDEVISCVEKNNVNSIATSDSEDEKVLSYVVGIFVILLAIIALIALIVFVINKIKNKYRARKEKIQQLNTKIEKLEARLIRQDEIASSTKKSLNMEINRLSAKNNQLQEDYQKLEHDYNNIKDRYERAIKLYPNIHAKITDMIEEEIRQQDMKAAKNADSIIARIINLSASKDRVSAFQEAKDYYSNLTPKQKSYVKSDITKLNRLYDESLKLKKEYDRKVKEEKSKKRAKEAAIAITSIISLISVGRASHLSRLKEAKSIYDDLDSDARVYFDKSILDRLDRLYKQAKRDKEEEERRKEEEERRRRESYYSSSSSSFGGSSGFSGFGGSSGGGGASRGF